MNSRITSHDSRITIHASRFTHHDSRIRFDNGQCRQLIKGDIIHHRMTDAVQQDEVNPTSFPLLILGQRVQHGLSIHLNLGGKAEAFQQIH